MRVRPLFDCVLVRVEEPPAGPIVIPDAWRSAPVEGVVLAVGPGAVAPDGSVRPVQVLPGERVVWNVGSGERVELEGGERALVLRESAILAVLG